MKMKRNKLAEWQLARERFHIARAFPPKPLRPEKTIGTILSEIRGEEPAADTRPEMLQTRWTAIAGEQIARHTHPSVIRGSRLIVFADHPGWLTEIRRLPTKHLLKKIASIPGMPAIKEIRFQLDPEIRNFRKWK